MRAYQLVNIIEAVKTGKVKLDFVKVDGNSIEITVTEKDFWLCFEKYELEIALKSVGFKKIKIIEQ